MSSRILLAVCVAATIAGCATQDSITLEYTPMPVNIPGLAAKTFNVSVDDQRSYEWRQRQPPSYLGTVRDTGATRHVLNEGDRSLADQVGKDLRGELRSLGLVESYASPVARIRVRILAWNFQATAGTYYRYLAEISVADTKGRVLESSMIQDELEVDGSAGEPMRESVSGNASRFYSGFIRKLVRENPVILAALERGR